MIALKNNTNLVFKEFFETYYTAGCLFSIQYLNDIELSKDIVQDSFVNIWQADEIYEDINHIKTHLFQIIKSKALNELKHQKVVKKVHENIIIEKESDNFFRSNYIEQETKRLIVDAINNLQGLSKKICLLSLQGCKNPEIAENLNCSIDTIKYHKKNAYRKMRVQLKEFAYSAIFLSNILFTIFR